MQTLRKKGSPCKYRNDPGRFFGEGVVFKAKLIGILEVGEARGDRMCQEALQDLKIAIRAAGEHKQRITIHVTIDGLRLRDEKTGDSLYHHPVHKISFIAQDMTDSRAFGYIFGSPDSGHRFFGIKTDKAASQVVLAMRDLFQVVFELKKKEIELARQNIQTKAVLVGGGHSSHHTMDKLKDKNEHKLSSLAKGSFMDETSFIGGGTAASATSSSVGHQHQMGDLVDLEQELSSIQRGITQMEKITPNELPMNKLDSEDPFGDSFSAASSSTAAAAGNTQFNILPPPPESSKTRQAKATSSSSSVAVSSSSHRNENDWSPPLIPPPTSTQSSSVTKQDLAERVSHSPIASSSDWLADEMNSLFDRRDDDLGGDLSGRMNSSGGSRDDSGKYADAFIDLDPLGTGKNKPYVDKKFFFQDVKNPPKKVLKELSSSDVNFSATFQANGGGGGSGIEDFTESSSRARKTSNDEEHRFSDQTLFTSTTSSGRDSAPQKSYFDTFDDPFELDPKLVEQQQPQQQRRPSTDRRPSESNSLSINNNNSSLSVPLKVILPPETTTSRSGGTSRGSTPRNRSPNLLRDRVGGDSGRKGSYESTRRIRQSPDYSADAPEPPPRPDMSHGYHADPPPLPPKKQFSDFTIRASNRPPMSNFKLSMSSSGKETSSSSSSFTKASDVDAPPLPLPSRRVGHTESKFPGPERPQKQEEDGYLFPLPTSPNVCLLPPPKQGSTKRSQKKQRDAANAGPPLSPRNATGSSAESVTTSTGEINTEITLSQLLQLSLDELADKLNVSAQKLSTMTIVELTKYLSEFLSKEKETTVTTAAPLVGIPPPSKNLARKHSSQEQQQQQQNVFKVSFDDEDNKNEFVAVFDDNFGEEENSGQFVADFDNANIQMAANEAGNSSQADASANRDRYAVFREIFETEVPDLLSSEDVEAVSEDMPNEQVEYEEEELQSNLVMPPAPPKIDTSITATISQAKDRYAALRDIVLVENLFDAPIKRPNSQQEVEEPEADIPEPINLLDDDNPGSDQFMSDNFVSDNFGTETFGDYEDEKTITSSHINVESPEERTDYELKDKSCTPTFVSARDDLEIDELMNLAVSNLSLNNINSLSPKTTELQLKNASTSPLLRGQPLSPSPLEVKNVIDTSTSPIIMHKMLSPVTFDRNSPQPVMGPTKSTTPTIMEEEQEDEEEDIGEQKAQDQVVAGSPLPDSVKSGEEEKNKKFLFTKPEEKWTAFEEPSNERRRPGKQQPPTGDTQQMMESPCSSDDKDELKVLNKKWPKGHTSSSSRDVSPWDDEFGEGRRRVSPAVDRQGHYMRHGRRMDSDDDYEYENEYEAAMVRDGGRWPQQQALPPSSSRDMDAYGHYKYGDRGNWHREPGAKLRSGRSYEKRKFYSSHGRKTYDYGDVGGRGGDGGMPFDIGAPVRPSSGSSRDRMKGRDYYGGRERRSFDRESNDSYDSGSGGNGPARKPRREYRNEYYGSIELMPDEYDLDVNKKRYASLEKGHKSSGRRTSSRRSNSDAYEVEGYDDQDESEEGECRTQSPHYPPRPYLTEGSKSLQRGGNRMSQSREGKQQVRKNSGSGSSPWDSKPSPIYNNKVSWSARPSSASEVGAVDRHRYFSTQALTIGCSDTEKERRQRLKGVRGTSSSSTVQLAAPQSAGGRRYGGGNEFTFDDSPRESQFHAKGVMRKSLRGARDAAYSEDADEGGRGSNRKLNISLDHPKYERTNSRPQPMEGKYYHSRGGGEEDQYHQHQQHHHQYDDDQLGDDGQQGFESDFIASSPVKSAGSLKNRPIFRFSTDSYSNNNSPGVESNASGSGGQNGGSQPKLRFNEKVKVSNYKTNYLEEKSDSLESPVKDQFEDNFSNLADELGDQWDENFAPQPTRSVMKDKDIRKSESVNIFAKKCDDPFEDDDFFKSESGGNGGPEDQQPKSGTGGGGDQFNWNHNFAKFEDNNIL